MNPDIALVDWVMEPEDGIYFVKNIRGAEDSPNRLMPIIMVSGYSEESRVLAARDAGANEFVVKPFSATSLFTRIQWVVENPRRFVTTDTYFGPDRRRKDVPFKGDDRHAGGSSLNSGTSSAFWWRTACPYSRFALGATLPPSWWVSTWRP